MRIPDELAAIELANFTTASLYKVNDGPTENNGVAAAAATLAPAVAEESRDPEREKTNPNSRRSYQVMKSVFTRVNICNIVCGVVIIRSIIGWGGGAASFIVNTNTCIITIIIMVVIVLCTSYLPNLYQLKKKKGTVMKRRT